MKLYNSLSQQKQPLQPIVAGQLGIYVCGMTVYDYCHIGHARSLIVFDVIVRYLRSRGYKVNYVRNITDIDDKIIKRANENQESCEALTHRFIEAMHEDERALGIVPPNHEPRATEYVPEIIALIEKILQRGLAYVADNGDVCFDLQNAKDYGKLSKRDIEKLLVGTRAQVDSSKRYPLDFVLWKRAKPGEPQWDSPWGSGRPGWHIECSAMSSSLLGQPFDIHGGGMDLKFPHHENEIAQSEAACGCDYANVWMHAGLLKVNGEKMSKSLNNFFTIRDVLAEHHPEVLRYFMLSANYRSPVNYSAQTLAQIRSSLERVYLALRCAPKVGEADLDSPFAQRFYAAMDDDFNTPEAFAVLFDMVKEINRLVKTDSQQAANLAALLKVLAEPLGLFQTAPEKFLKQDIDAGFTDKIEALLEERTQARQQKNWQRADEIRAELTALGVTIEDANGQTRWRLNSESQTS